MTTLRRLSSAATLALAASAGWRLASAAVRPAARSRAHRPRPASKATGSSADGVAVSRLSGGVFTTTALDTGNKLADGSYKVTGSNTVEITVISLIRNTTSSVNCALVTGNQLNCTSSTGQQFVLTRRA